MFNNWEKLRVLRLHKNYLPSIPSEIKQLKNLVELYLQFNHLETLTPDIGHLKEMKVLRVNNNLLSELPPPLGIMHNLEELTVLPKKKKLRAAPLTLSGGHTTTATSTTSTTHTPPNVHKDDAAGPSQPGSLSTAAKAAGEEGADSSPTPSSASTSDNTTQATPERLKSLQVGWEETYKLRITSPPPDVLHLGINDILSFLCQLLNGSERYEWPKFRPPPPKLLFILKNEKSGPIA